MPEDPISPLPGVSLEGYADELAIRAGDTIRLHASATPGPARLDVVRLVHGDPNPLGPGQIEEEIECGQPREVDLRMQLLDRGSFVRIPHADMLNPRGSFSFAFWFEPRLLDAHWLALAAKWAPGELGYAVFCTGQRTLTAAVSFDGATAAWCTAGNWVSNREWQFVCLSLDVARGELALFCDALSRPLQTAPPMIRFEKPVPPGPLYPSRAPLLLGALERPDGAGHWAHLNGKIARPVLLADALGRDEAQALMNGAAPEQLAPVIGRWDLSLEVSRDRVIDVSGHGNDGVAVNAPGRAVTGPFWTGTEATLYTDKPHLYDAVHLHEDDIDDAGWQPSAELMVPQQARSGLYAFRLRRDCDELYVPFIVRPRTMRAAIAFLIPTLTWQAYSTNRGPYSYTGDGIVDRGLCIYDGHRDGSMVYYASRRRPTRSHHPARGFQNWGCHNTTANLYLIRWLETRGFEYEVHSDEDLHRDGVDLLRPYRCVLLGSHPEYWTGAMLDGLRDYLEGGGRVIYLGGNGLFWVTSIDPARPWLMEVRKSGDWQDWWSAVEPGQLQHSTTLEPGGMWSRRGRPPRRFLGVETAANVFEDARGRWGFRRLPASYQPPYDFAFEGVSEDVIGDFGLNLGAAAAYEMDAVLEWDWPAGEEPVVLARATHELFVPLDRVPVAPVCDIAMRTLSGGGAVFAAGSVAWTGSLSHNGYDNNVSRITENVLRRFVAAPAGSSVLV